MQFLLLVKAGNGYNYAQNGAAFANHGLFTGAKRVRWLV